MNTPRLTITEQIIPPVLQVQSSDLPNWQDLPQACRQELVLALAALLMEQPEVQHEPQL